MTLAIIDPIEVLQNAFCPRGKGRGVDPTCSPDRHGRVPNALPRIDGKTEQRIEKALEVFAKPDSVKEFLSYSTTEETVRISAISSPQSVNVLENVNYFKNNPEKIEEGKLPLVIQFGSLMMLRDGNSRVTAAKDLGKETVKVRVVYVPEILTANAKRRSKNPLRLDPSRTLTLRSAYAKELRGRFARLQAAIVKLIVIEDAFGLSRDAKNPMTGMSGGFVGNEEKEFASTQLNIKDEVVAKEIRELQGRLEKEDVLNLSKEPHVTIRYGLEDDSQLVNKVKKLIEAGSVTVEIGSLSLFNLPDKDVLKYEVMSNQLTAMNARFGLLPHEDTHDTYRPHLTVAYLKPGTGKKYLTETSWLKGKKLWISELVVSDAERNHTFLTMNNRWKLFPVAEKLRAFKDWLKAQIGKEIFKHKQADDEDAIWQRYAEAAVKRGASRTFDDLVRSGKINIPEAKINLPFFDGSREQFLRQAFTQPVAIEKLKILATRQYEDLKGVTEAMATQMQRTLVDGLAQGLHPREIAKNLTDKVNTIGKVRANAITQTETIRAHAQGQLVAFEQLGVHEIGVAVEWETAGDNTVCPQCRPMEGAVFSLEEAQTLIPRHVNCRCAFVPANVGEPTKGQTRSAGALAKAIKRSLKGQKKSKWPGAGLKVSKRRPKSVFNQGPLWLQVLKNVYCATGPGGGKDPTCSPSGSKLLPVGGVGLKAVKLSAEARKAVEEFQDNSFEINGYLREGGTVPEKVQRQIISLKKAIDKHGVVLKEDVVLYRGLDEEEMPRGKFQDRAFISTTTDPQAAAFFGNRVMMLKVAKGTKVLPILRGKEQEVILPQWKFFSEEGPAGTIRRGETDAEVTSYAVNHSSPVATIKARVVYVPEIQIIQKEQDA